MQTEKYSVRRVKTPLWTMLMTKFAPFPSMSWVWERHLLLLPLCCLVWNLNAFQNYKENIYSLFFFLLLLSSSFPFRISREWTLFVLIYNCSILRNVQRDVFHISSQKSMPVLIFSKHSIRYVSGCLERFVSRAHELCSGGRQICFPVGQKKKILAILLLPVN